MIKIFCDLDGVLADFDTRAEQILGQPASEVPDKIMWPKLLAHEGGFFTSLDWMPGAKKLWAFLKKQDVTILTGIPREKTAPKEKKDWCKKNLGDKVKVICCQSKKKYTYVEKEYPCILIDDRPEIIEAWQTAGGIGILHKRGHNVGTILKLKKMINEIVPEPYDTNTIRKRPAPRPPARG